MTVSYEITVEHRHTAPPFAESCPNCVSSSVFVPHATLTVDGRMLACYTHGACGHDWVTEWDAQWADHWHDGDGPGQRAVAA